ncbi:MAG: asparagine synthase-related protein, partial [Chitinophagaceae bacterium]
MQLVRKMEVDLHLQRILLKVDRASMYHSLEVRVPLLSNAMLEKSLQYNYDDCIQNKMGKMNLRKILMEKAGKDLVMQPKKGFTVPMDKWLRNDLKKEVTEKIMDMPSRLAVFFEREKIQRMLALHAAGKQHCGWFIWALYVLVRWDDTHHKNYTIN